MKKITFIGFWDNFNPETMPLTKYIREFTDVEITDIKHADYVFFSVQSEKHWFAPDDSIKIFYTGENLTPDFNACDYAIGFDWMEYGDRYMRLPLYYLYKDICEQSERKHLLNPEAVAKEKTGFCSITVSNSRRNPIFQTLFEELSKYKKVDSGGRWNNNIGGPVADKQTFDASHKFSIVCENSAHPGYTTEKLVQAFAANCIPIYWGDPEVARVFNTRAFINVPDYSSVEEVADIVRRIDTDEQYYHAMLREPVFNDEAYYKARQIEKLKEFLSYIFSQPKEKACRRNREFYGLKYVKDHRTMARATSNIFFSDYRHKMAVSLYYKFRNLIKRDKQ